MELTRFGMVLLPLCAAACVAPFRLLELVFLASAFGAAAVAVVGGLGLPPGLPPAALFIGFVALQYALGARFPGACRSWRLLEPFAIAVAYALATAVLLPRLFAGRFEVWPQKVDAAFALPVPLAPSLANVTQALYLVSNALVAILGGMFLTRSDVDFRRLLHAYYAGGAVVLLVCFWQVLNRLAGVPYPAAFLYSNPGWALFPSQDLGGVPRINGPFSEPASLTLYLSGTVFSAAWVLVRGYRSRFAALLLPPAVVAMLLSTSTTAYAVLGAGAAFLLLYAAVGAAPRVATRILAFGIPMVVLALLGVVVLADLDPRFAASVQAVVTQTLQKGWGTSYAERSLLDIEALGVLPASYGLGAGWGSARSSSLIPGLLANLGVAGVVPLAWFAVRLRRHVARVRRLPVAPDRLMVIDAMSASLVGSLTASVLSSPAITTVDFYLVLAVLVGCVARVEYEAAGTTRRIAVAAALPARAA
ncbi:hypothetical protein [Limobrevibacterium gyesilva]|uniref:Uncharacterized protein n=1 Tax=Limobrevibacterium gyesilva TaxID=2991712 RepID=A0AA41YKK3_9PROT|nr:hypothetical protein [Limobrevibacterium gyesilva]MCW3475476.1 hypothetical protein [Limobrevibacterium gyesilva]